MAPAWLSPTELFYSDGVLDGTAALAVPSRAARRFRSGPSNSSHDRVLRSGSGRGLRHWPANRQIRDAACDADCEGSPDDTWRPQRR